MKRSPQAAPLAKKAKCLSALGRTLEPYVKQGGKRLELKHKAGLNWAHCRPAAGRRQRANDR